MSSKRSQNAKRSVAVHRAGKKLWRQYELEVAEEKRLESSRQTVAEYKPLGANGAESVCFVSTANASNIEDSSMANVRFDNKLKDDRNELNEIAAAVSDGHIDTDTVNKNQSFTEALKNWAFKHKVPETTFNDLLHLIRENADLYLPLE